MVQGRIDDGIGAHEDYAATINELNALAAGDCRQGEALCRQALIQLETIQAARTAKLEIEKYRQQLQMRLRKLRHSIRSRLYKQIAAAMLVQSVSSWPGATEPDPPVTTDRSAVERLFYRAGRVLYWLTGTLLLVTVLAQLYMALNR